MPAAKTKPAVKKSAARKRAAPGVSLSNALANAAWSEADAALAEALALCDEAIGARDAATRDAALTLLEQALSRAGRKRGLTRLGALGKTEVYDPQYHELTGPSAGAPISVRVIARGVARGDETLVKRRVQKTRSTGRT